MLFLFKKKCFYFPAQNQKIKIKIKSMIIATSIPSANNEFGDVPRVSEYGVFFAIYKAVDHAYDTIVS